MLPNSSMASLWPIVVFSVDGFALFSDLYIIVSQGASRRDTQRMEESYLPQRRTQKSMFEWGGGSTGKVWREVCVWAVGWTEEMGDR